MTKVVVDADYLAYSCGFAVEKVLYSLIVERPDGTTDEAMFRTKDEIEAYLSYEPEGVHTQLDRVVDAEPLHHALFLVNRTLRGVEERLTEAGLDFDRLELFLTGKGNFRDTLATIKGYKANRLESRRPVHYKSIRRYLVDRWGATTIEGYEADDAVAWEAASRAYDPERVVIVSVDKDLQTVPGLHYNFKSKQLRVNTIEEAQLAFYRQLVMGDATDNIGGAYKAGEKAAETAIAPGSSEEEWYANALALYAAGLEKPKCPYAGMSPEAALLENARLLWMLRAEHDVWMPPHQREPARPGLYTVPGLNGRYDPDWIKLASPMITKSWASGSGSASPVTPATSAEAKTSGARSRTRRTSGSATG